MSTQGDIPAGLWAQGAMGDPATSTPDNRSPWGFKPRMGVREHAYPDPIKVMDLVIAAVFKNPTDMIKALVPFEYFEGEIYRIEEWVSKTSQFGPLSNQAPFSEYGIRRRAYQLTMTAYGKQFVIDESLYKTPIEHIYRSMHMQQLIGGMHYTMYLLFMRTILACPTVYQTSAKVSREKQGLTPIRVI